MSFCEFSDAFDPRDRPRPMFQSPFHEELERVRRTDATVHQMLNHGAALGEVVVALAREKEVLIKRLVDQESRRPIQIIL